MKKQIPKKHFTGVSLVFETLESDRARSKVLRDIIHIITLFFALAGTIWSLLSLFHIEINIPVILGWLLLLSVLWVRFHYLSRELKKRILFFGVIVLLVLGAFLNRFISGGFNLAYSQVARVILNLSDAYDMIRPVSFPLIEHPLVLLIFFLYISVFYSFLIYLCTVQKSRIFFLMLFTFPLAFIGLVWTTPENLLPLFMLICSYVVTLGAKVSSETAFLGGRVRAFADSVSDRLLLMGIVVVLFATYSFFVSRETYQRPTFLDGTRQILVNAVGDLNETIFGERDILQRSFVDAGGIGNADRVVKKDEPLIGVRSSLQSDLHLRFFLGADYDPVTRRWIKIATTEMGKYDSLFSDQTYDPFFANEYAIEKFLINEDDISEYLRQFRKNKLDIFIYPAFSMGELYLPYNLISAHKGDSTDFRETNYDWNLYPHSSSTYEYQAEHYTYLNRYEFIVNNNYDRFTDDLSHLLDPDSMGLEVIPEIKREDISSWSIEKENRYSEMVHDLYTKVDQSILDILPEELNFSSETAKLDVIYQTMLYFCENYTQTDIPGRVPDDREVMDYFLNETKTGTGNYIVTALTLILRSNEIPARYVEGFQYSYADFHSLSEENESELPEDERGFIYATDYDYGPWCEIYVDGLGWVPLSFKGAHVYTRGEVLPAMETIDYDEGDAGKDTGVDPEAIKAENLISEQMEYFQNKGDYSKEELEMIEDILRNPAFGSFPEDPTFGYKMWAGAVISAILALLILALRAWMVRKRRDKKFAITDPNRAAIEGISYVYKMLEYEKMPRKNEETMAEYHRRIEEKLVLREGRIERVTEICLYARYSQRSITAKEAEEVLGLKDSIHYDLYDKKDFKSKYYAKHIRAVY